MTPMDKIIIGLMGTPICIVLIYFTVRLCCRAIFRSYFEERNRGVVNNNPTKEQ